MHNNKVQGPETRKGYYDLLNTILLCKEAYSKIKSLAFNKKNILTALRSIQNLAINMGKNDKDKLIKYLYTIYYKIKEQLLDNLL